MNELLLLYFVGGILVLMVLLGLGVAIVMPAIDPYNRRFFITAFLILLLCIIIIFGEVLIYQKPAYNFLEKVICFFSFLFPSLLTLLMALHLLHASGENWRTSVLSITGFVLMGIQFLLLCIAQFTTFLYYVSPENISVRGPWFALLIVPWIIFLILCTVGVIRRRGKLQTGYFVTFLVYLSSMIIALIIHVIMPAYLLIYISMILSALSMFCVILSDQIRQYLRQQRELAHQRASIMVLQMRPHFIYNTMTGIYYLCDQDPQKAKQVTLDFTTYLRKNFTAIASEEPIPFTSELEHTRAYLAVEQAQYEDCLLVDFDTPHTMFRLPPLTLQPIVENAVKHGLSSDFPQVHIFVKTRKTSSGSEITVENDGSEFNPESDAEPHIALSNIRQRLEMMCGGKLTIQPREGGGVVVTVSIPCHKA